MAFSEKRRSFVKSALRKTAMDSGTYTDIPFWALHNSKMGGGMTGMEAQDIQREAWMRKRREKRERRRREFV